MRFVSLAPLIALLAAACAPKAPPASISPSTSPAPAATASATPVQVTVHSHGGNGAPVTIFETLHGRKVYTIRAISTVGERFGTNQATGDLEQPHITFVDKSGATTIADAPKAHLTEREKTIVMMGGVHARTSGGSVLTCDTLTYNGATERLHGEGNVRLTASNGLQLGGQHLDGDVRLQDIRVTGGSG